MTKTEQILNLYDGCRTTREIAELVGCDMAYVRVVARQRNGGSSEADLRYWASEAGIAARQRHYTAKKDSIRSRSAAYQRVIRSTGDKALAATRAQAAKEAARKHGADKKEQQRLYSFVYSRILRETGDLEKAREAARAH